MLQHYPKLVVILFFAIAIFTMYFSSTPEPLNDLYRGTGGDSFEEYYLGANQSLDTQQSKVSFFAVGDIMLSRNVAGQISKNNKDGTWPFKQIQSTLAETDFNFGNLESPFTGRDDFDPYGPSEFNAPTWSLSGLLNSNFKVLNLANNHAMDQELNGLLYTAKLLKDNGITSLGTGSNLDEAWLGKVLTVDGISIGFIGASYASVNDGGTETNEYVARIEDSNRLFNSIQELKTRSDYIIVAMHAGTEYVRDPNPAQIAFAHAAIDAGADMVIGTHSHWVQPYEKYRNKYIFYGLGNFVFDQEWSEETKQGLMLKISLEKNDTCPNDPRLAMEGRQAACGSAIQGGNVSATLKQVQLVPIIIENYGQPRLATDLEKDRILNKISATTDMIAP